MPRSAPRADRRSFLKAGLLGSAALAAPMFVPGTCFGANERINLGFIGAGGRARVNLKELTGAGAVAAAVCDVDSDNIARWIASLKDATQGIATVSDFRRLLERKDLDAVVISTPDHWHALLTIAACQAGKDVYCEKPLSLTIGDGRRMVTAAREHGRIVQTGSQQRSAPEFLRACTLVRNGAIGDIQEVHAGISGANHPGPLGPDADPPPQLDYDLWLGPAKFRPYNEKRVHYNFRFWWDYSGGQMTNWGAHHIDIAQWGLGMDGSGPVRSEGIAEFNPNKVHEVTESCRITHTYANGVKLIVGQKQKDIEMGAKFVGTKGTIHVNRNRLTTDPAELATVPLEGYKEQLYNSPNHAANFLDCIRSRKLPICDVEIGHRTATICHLGNIVARLGRGVQWDPAKEQITGDAEAQAMTDREYRAPWKHGGNV